MKSPFSVPKTSSKWAQLTLPAVGVCMVATLQHMLVAGVCPRCSEKRSKGEIKGEGDKDVIRDGECGFNVLLYLFKQTFNENLTFWYTLTFVYYVRCRRTFFQFPWKDRKISIKEL